MKTVVFVGLTVVTLVALAADSSSRKGRGQFYNGCPAPQEVYIHVCNGTSTHNFRLKQGEKHELDVLQGATYAYMCSGQGSQANQSCPHAGAYVPLK